MTEYQKPQVFEAVYTRDINDGRKSFGEKRESRGFFVGNEEDVKKYCDRILEYHGCMDDGSSRTRMEPRGELVKLDEGEKTYLVNKGKEIIFVKGAKESIIDYFGKEKEITEIKEIPLKEITSEYVGNIDFLEEFRKQIRNYYSDLSKSERLKHELEETNKSLQENKNRLNSALERFGKISRGDKVLENILKDVDMERVKREFY